MEKLANDTAASYTAGELRGLAASRGTWVVLAAIIAVLALTGPFNTYQTLALPQRGAYWAVAATASFWIGFGCSHAFAFKAEELRAPPLLALILGSVAAGLAIAVFVALLDWMVFGGPWSERLVGLVPYTISIAIIVGAVYEFLSESRQQAPGQSRPTGPISTGPFAHRLPAELGSDIVWLQAQDHYVKVRTSKGSALVLISMNQACDELGGHGLRVHRSWWVANRHMRKLTYRKAALCLVTSLGDIVPVGRKYRSQIRAAMSAAESMARISHR